MRNAKPVVTTTDMECRPPTLHSIHVVHSGFQIIDDLGSKTIDRIHRERPQVRLAQLGGKAKAALIASGQQALDFCQSRLNRDREWPESHPRQHMPVKWRS
ncbi:MAG TPA: hypothetical protein VFU50_07145 [Terriglobales bacterium]|nr:hypothetical protein [Terriglobales bacterium]